MNNMVPIIFAILAGIFTTIEAAINTRLGRIVTPKIATLHNLVIGLIVILVGTLIRGSLSEYKKIIHVSPIWLIGGAFGTFIVYFCIKSASKLGIATTLTIVVAAQLISSILFDYFLLDQQQIQLYKIIGVFFLMIGTYLICK